MLRFLIMFLLMFALFFLSIRKIVSWLFGSSKETTSFTRKKNNKKMHNTSIDLVKDEKTGQYHIKKD